MARHVDQLRTIEQLLVDGHLDEAKVMAFSLTKPEADPGMAPWVLESNDTVRAARGLAAARTVEEALHDETLVAAECAACHLRVQRLPRSGRFDAPMVTRSRLEAPRPAPAARRRS